MWCLSSEPFDRAGQTFLFIDLQFPTQDLASLRNIGATALWIIDTARLIDNRRRRIAKLNNSLSILANRMLTGIAQIEDLAQCARVEHGPHQTINQVADITDAACFRAITVN